MKDGGIIMCNVTKRILSLVCVLCVLINALPISLAEDLIAPVVQYEEEVGLTNESPAEPAVIFDNTDQYEGVVGESVVTIEEGAPRSEDRGDEGSTSLEPETAQEDQAATMETIVIAEEPASQEEPVAPDALIEPVLIEPDDEQKKEKKDESTPNLVTLNEEFRFEASEKSNYVIYLMAPEDGDYHFVSTGEGLWLYVQNIEDRGVIYADKMIKTDPETKVLDYTMSLVQGVYVLTIGNDGQDQESFAAVVYTDAVYQELYSAASQINTVEAEDQKSIGETKDHDNIDENVNKQQDVAEEADLSELAQEQLAENDIADDTADNTVNETVDNANNAAEENNDTGVDTNDNQAPGEEDNEQLNNDTLINDEKTEDENALKEDPTDDVSDEAVNEDGGEEADTEDGGEQMRSLMKMPGVIMPLMVSPENYTYKQYEFRVRFDSAASARNNVNLAYEITQISTGSVLDTAELSVEDSNGNNIWITSVSLPEELVSRNDVGIRLVSGVDSNDLYALTDEYVITATTITVRVVDKEDKEVGVNWGLENDYWGSFAQVPEEIHYSVYLKENKQNAVTGNTQQENILYGTYTIGKDDDWEKTIRIPAGCEWYVEAENPDDFICSISSYDPLVIDMTDNTTIYDAYEYHVAIQWEDDDNALGNRPAIENTEITISDERGRTITKNVMIKADEGWFVSINAGVPLSSIRVVLTDPSNDYTYSALGTGATEFVFDATVAYKTHIITAELNAKHEFSFGWDDDNNSNDLRPEELTVKYGFGATEDEAAANLTKTIYDANVTEPFTLSIPQDAQYLAIQINDNANGTGQNGYYRYEADKGTTSGNKIIFDIADAGKSVIVGKLVSLDGKRFVPVTVTWNDEIGEMPQNIILKYTQTNDPSALPENLDSAASISLLKNKGWADRILVDDDKQYLVYEIVANNVYYSYSVADGQYVKAGKIDAVNISDKETLSINTKTDYQIVQMNLNWNDNENQNNYRPSSVKFDLIFGENESLYNKEKYVPCTVTLDTENHWSTNVLVPKDAQFIKYSCKNKNTPYEYHSEYDVPGEKALNLNNHSEFTVIGTDSKVRIPLKIEWNDFDNEAGQRPSSLVIKFISGSETLEELKNAINEDGVEIVVRSTNNWKTEVWVSEDATLFVYNINDIGEYSFESNGQKYINILGQEELIITGVYGQKEYTICFDYFDDENNRMGKRPSRMIVWVKFYSDDEDPNDMKYEQYVLTPNNNHTIKLTKDRHKNHAVLGYYDDSLNNAYNYTIQMEYTDIPGTVNLGYRYGNTSATANNVKLYDVTLTGNKISIAGSIKYKYVPVRVEWNDNNNIYGVRPASVKLKSNRMDYYEQGTQITNEDKNWEVLLLETKTRNVIDVAVYIPQNSVSGKDYNVSLKNSTYSSTFSLSSGGEIGSGWKDIPIPTEGEPITVIFTPIYKGAYAKIEWKNEDSTSVRPASIPLQVMYMPQYSESVSKKNTTITSTNNWQKGHMVPNSAYDVGINIFSNTEKKKQIIEGDYAYTIFRHGEQIDFCDMHLLGSDGEHTIYADYLPNAKPNITVEWQDNNNERRQRPTSIDVIPLISGNQAGLYNISEDDNWNKTIDVSIGSVYRDGDTLDYKVSGANDNYDYIIKYGHTYSEVIIVGYLKEQVKIDIQWNDNDNQYGARPEWAEIVVGENDLCRITKDDNWTKDIDNIAVFNSDGAMLKDHLDLIHVNNVSEFYKSPSIEYDSNTNTITIIMSVFDHYIFKSIWNDNENEAGDRPDSISFKIYSLNNLKQNTVLSTDNEWEEQYDLLYRDEYNRINDYVIKELNGVPDTYETEYIKEGYVYSIVNTRKNVKKTSVAVTINWLELFGEDRPGSVTVELKNGDSIIASNTVTAEDDWKTVFENVPKYDESNKEISYTVSCVAPDRYNTSVVKVSNTKHEINLTELRQITLEVAFKEGIQRPQTVKYTYNGITSPNVDSETGNALYTDWVPSVNNYNEEVHYSPKVSSSAPAIQTAWVDEVEPMHFIFHQKDPTTIDYHVKVVWDDNENARGFRPNSVLVEFKNTNTGELYKSFNVDSNTWEIIASVQKYNDAGEEITYTITQTPVPSVYVNTLNIDNENVEFYNDLQEDWAYYVGLEWDTSDAAKRYVDNRVTTSSSSQVTFKYKLTVSTNGVVYEPGQLQVRMPYVLSNSLQRGKAIKYGVSTQNKNIKWEIPTDISVPQAPNYNELYSFNYSIDDHGTPDNKLDDEIIFTNWKQLPAGFNQTLSVIYKDFSYFFEDTVPATLKANAIGNSEDGRSIALESNSISCSVDTGVDTVLLLNVSSGRLLRDWDTSNSVVNNITTTRPNTFDPDKYAYVTYSCRNVLYGCTQQFRSEYTISTNHGGEVAYYKIVGVDQQPTQVGNTLIGKSMALWISGNNGSFTNTRRDTEYLYLIMRYPKNQLDPNGTPLNISVTVNNICDYEHEGDKGPNDKNDVRSASISTSVTWKEYVVDYSGQIYASSKTSDISKKNQILFLKNGISRSAKFTVTGAIDGYKLLSEDGFSYIVTDDDYYVRGIDENGNLTGWFKMGDGDYSYQSFKITNDYSHFNPRTGGLTKYTANVDKVQIRRGNSTSWESYSSKEYNASVSTSKQDNITGVRLISTQGVDGRATYSLNLTIAVHPSPLIMSLINNGAIELEIANLDTLRAYIGKIGDENGANWLRPDFTNSPAAKAQLQAFGIWDEDMAAYGCSDYHNYAAGVFGYTPSTAQMRKDTISIKNDAINSKVDVNFEVMASETHAIENIPEILKDLLWPAGTFYDLLPKGYAYRDDIGVKVYEATKGNERRQNAVRLDSVETIDNYKGSGRQLLIVKVHSTDYSVDPNSFVDQEGIGTGYIFTYTASISWDDLAHNRMGTNHVVFQVSDNREMRGARYDDGESTFYVAGANESNVFEDINGDGVTNKKDTLCAYSQVNPDVATTIENGIHKLVRASSGVYSTSDVTSHGKTYSYKLLFDASDGGETRNVIIYDILEEAANSGMYSGEISWKGTFSGINVEAAKRLRIDPVIYYSTANNLNYNDIGNGTQSIQNNTEIWSTTPPSDLSAVTAVAVDFSKMSNDEPYVIEDAGYIEFEIYMKAPSTAQEAEYAYNRPSAYSEFQLKSSTITDVQHNIGVRTKVKLTSLKDFSFKKRGYDESGSLKDILGVEFNLYKCSEEPGSEHHGIPGEADSCWGTTPVYSATSDINGVRINQLSHGIYALKEVATVSPYLMPNDNWWIINVDGRSLDPISIPQNGGTSDNHLSFTQDAATGDYVLVNQREYTDIELVKSWDGDWTIYDGKPASVVFDLYRNDQLYISNIEVTENDGWRKIINGVEKNLYKTSPSGTAYVYTVKEHQIPYTQVVAEPIDASGKINITNKRYGYFKLEKMLLDSSSSTEQFTFDVLVQDNTNMPLKNQTMHVVRANGTEENIQYTLGIPVTIGLANGDYIESKSLYAGTIIQITEIIPEDSDYTVSYHTKKLENIGDSNIQEIIGTNNTVTITLDTTTSKEIFAVNRLAKDFRFYKTVEREDGRYEPFANVVFKLVRCNHVCDNACENGCVHEHDGNPNSLTGCWAGPVIYRGSNGSLTVGNATSSATGLVVFDDLPYGNYALIENSAPGTSNRVVGVSKDNYWTVKVDENGVTVPVKNNNNTVLGYNNFEMEENISRKYPTLKNNIQKIYLRVQKTWSGVWEEIKPDSIVVDIYRNNVLYIENVELKASENWVYESPLVPKAAENNTVYTYTVKEHESSQYQTASITQFGTSTPLVDGNSQQYRRATITNSRKGVLYIEKKVLGAPIVPDAEYKIVLSSSDFVPGAEFRLTKIMPTVNQSATQTSQSTVTVGETKNIYLTLRDGEYAYLENLPVNIYINAEEIDLKPGYTPRYYSYNKTAEGAAPSWRLETTGAKYTGSAYKTSATAMPMMLIENEYKMNLNAEAVKYVNGHPAMNSPYADPAETPDRYNFRLEIAIKEPETGTYTVIGYSKPNGDSKSVTNVSAIEKFEKYGTIGYIPLTWIDTNGDMKSFDEIFYDARHAGQTFYYRIREDRRNENSSYVYDDAVYFLVVSVIDNGDGTLRIEKTIKKDDDQNGIIVDQMVFDNQYKAEGSLDIPVIKLLDTLASDITSPNYEYPYENSEMEFEFKISKVDVDFKEYFEHSGMNSEFAEYLLGLNKQQVGTEQSTTSGVASFRLNYTEQDIIYDSILEYAQAKSSLAWAFVNTPGCYMPLLYRIDEVNTQHDGVIYTDINSPCFVWVSLYDNGDGTLSPVVTNIIKVHKIGNAPAWMEGVLGKGAPINGRSYFVNEYHTEGDYVLSVKKKVNGVLADENTAGKFTFEMENADEGTPALKQGATNGNNGYAVFDSIHFDDRDIGKTYRYNVIEKSVDNDTAYTKDNTVYTVEVTISDDLMGGHNYEVSIKNGPTECNEIVFENDYTASGNLVVTSNKTIAGETPDAITEGKFHFTIELIPDEGEPVVVATGTNGINGEIKFTTIEYTISDAGKTYNYQMRETGSDLAQYSVDSAVYPFDVTIVDDYDGHLTANISGTSGTGTITFNNTFRPSLWVENQTASDQGGTVQVVGYDDTLSHASSDGSHNNEENRKYEALSIEANADRGWKIVLEETGIRLKTGEYRYLKDLPQDVNGNYVFSDNGVGALVQIENISEDKMRVSLVALNTDMDISVLFEQNTIWGENTTENDDGGKIKVAGYDDTESEVSSDGHHNNDENRKPTNVVTASANVGWKVDTENVYVAQKDGTKHYVKDLVSDSGEYEFVIANIGQPDERSIKFKIEKTDLRNVRVVIIDMDDDIDIGIPFVRNPVNIRIPVRKTIVGGHEIPHEQTFYFEIAGADGNTNLPSERRIEITGEGTASFDEITFEEANNYSYTIREINQRIPGYTFDSTVHNVTVRVYEDTDGLKTELQDGGEIVEEIAFENAYSPTPVNVSLPVKKTITGNDRPAARERFSFMITPQDNTYPVPASRTLTIRDTGSDTFGTITFAKAGVYTYVVTETAGSARGYEYDHTQHTIVITVVDDNGILRATWTDNGYTVTDIEFTNNYVPQSTSTSISVRKAITGDARPQQKETFTFSIRPVGDAPEFSRSTATITDAGTANFGTAEFVKAGVYDYLVTEERGSAVGYTYDTTSHVIRITVTDDNGALTLRATENGVQVGSILFTNTYHPTSTTLSIPVTKIITGAARPAQKEVFEFSITPIGSAPLPAATTVRITDEGSASFLPITFQHAGTYKYSVKERQGTAEGYTYDDTTKTVVVTVTDNAGTLTATYTVDGISADGVTFTNEYQPISTDLLVPVKKIITGSARPAEKEVFKFVIEKVNDEPIPETNLVMIRDEGEAEFLPITYTTAGTYNYRVREIVEDRAGYTYDDTIHALQVKVTDDRGRLVADWTVDGYRAQRIRFTNKYQTTPSSVVIPVRKSISGDVPPTEERFVFEIRPVTSGAPMPVTNLATVQGVGDGAFKEIIFEEAGVYEYIVQERAGSTKGYTYDRNTYKVTVVVEDVDSVLIAKYYVESQGAMVSTGTGTSI